MNPLIVQIRAINVMAETDPFAAAREAISLLHLLHKNSGSYQRSVLSPAVEALKNAVEILQSSIESLHE